MHDAEIGGSYPVPLSESPAEEEGFPRVRLVLERLGAGEVCDHVVELEFL
jgi:hypothetical protein